MAARGYLLLLLGLGLVGGCGPQPLPRTSDEQAMFGIVSFRIHPTFTQIKNWNPVAAADAKPTGIEAVIECQDQFGDPTRAAGTVRFELYGFHPSEPDHRGARIATWAGPLNSKEDQVQHWDPAARGYSFQLSYAKIQAEHAYVLTAQFDHNGTRLFDQLILEPSAKDGYHGDRRTQRAPSNSPGHYINY